jgi:hypothetical protein
MSIEGTHIAIFDYAIQIHKILGKESIIFYEHRSEQTQPLVFKKFQAEFRLIPYDQLNDI